MNDGLIIILVVIVLISNVLDSDGIPQKIPQTDLPECYVAQSNECVLGYKQIDMLGSSGSEFIQCCREPHYLLQGMDIALMNHYIKENLWTQGIFENYDCEFTRDRKKECTDISDCYERPEMEGCSRTADDCNTCCNNWCTTLPCTNWGNINLSAGGHLLWKY